MLIYLNIEGKFSKRLLWCRLQNDLSLDVNLFLFAMGYIYVNIALWKKIGNGMFIMKIIHYIYWNHIFCNGNILREGMEDSTH